jgi:hypothetical protein
VRHLGRVALRLRQYPGSRAEASKAEDFWDDSGQVTSAIEPRLTYTHSELYDRASKGSLCPNNYSRGWLTFIEMPYPSSRPSLYLSVPSRFRLRRLSAYPRLGVAIETGSCALKRLASPANVSCACIIYCLRLEILLYRRWISLSRREL